MQQSIISTATFSHVLLLNLLLGLLSLAASAQETQLPAGYLECVIIYEPEFPGGSQKLQDYLARHTHYPVLAAKAGMKGSVFVSFFVEMDGRITNVSVVKGMGYGCDEEAIRVIKTMPRWVPGGELGQTIRAKRTLSIAFGPK